MDYRNSDQLIFVLASPAGGGHRLGRIICCLENIYWYSSKGNGLNPWSVIRQNPNKVKLSAARVKGRKISKYHFDRRTSQGMIPLIGKRIEKYWEQDDIENFYDNKWQKEMDAAGAKSILELDKNLVWVLHDTPQHLLTRFPQAKIINLVDADVDTIVSRYLKTTALFPINIENKSIKPDYLNLYAIQIKELNSLNPNPTYRDFWAWTTHSEPVYLEKFDTEYLEYVSATLFEQHTERIKENPKYINVSWDKFNINDILEYLEISDMDENYLYLLNVVSSYLDS